MGIEDKITNEELRNLMRRHEVDVDRLPPAFLEEVNATYEKAEHASAAVADSEKRLIELEKELHIDHTTNLFKKRKFIEDISGIVALYNESKIIYNGTNGCWLFFMDINQFKEINDKYGHIEGDKVLLATGHELNALTGTKGTREDGTAYRYGGDELTILMHGTYEQGIELGKRIRETFNPNFFVNINYDDRTIQIPLTLSIGASYFPDDLVEQEKTGKAWAKKADRAMYAAKALSGGRFSVFEVEKLR